MRGDRVGCLPHHSQYQSLPHLHHMLLMCPTWRKRRPVLRVKEHLLQLSWTCMYDVFQLEMLEVIRFPSLVLLSIVAKCFFHYIYICSFVDYYVSSGRFLQHNARRCENASVARCPSLQGRMTSLMSKYHLCKEWSGGYTSRIQGHKKQEINQHVMQHLMSRVRM